MPNKSYLDQLYDRLEAFSNNPEGRRLNLSKRDAKELIKYRKKIEPVGSNQESTELGCIQQLLSVSLMLSLNQFSEANNLITTKGICAL